jgi:pilus assembly protein Flp/PilA
MLRLYAKMRALPGALADDSGQDLVEFALVLVLIALAAVVAMNGLAVSIGAALTSVGGYLTSYTS